ncbi:hypothetical protein [Rhizobium sp. BK661]|uniref:hypothetical protein n=1 Tax=Rhizobium sp. BK661 TaxID=2586991 RepID=UPI002168AA21|nr:hypothetical protein [Rhizobium sp. BK661]MCS3742142.1 hypothetical protein [Rhizobium sp. BK661]
MTSRTNLVEVAVTSKGERLALGIMNAKQALSLAEAIEIEISHPDHETGHRYIYRSGELKARTSRDM